MRPVISTETTRPRSMARAAMMVMMLFVASRVLGLLRDIVISHQFGTSRALDAYLSAFTIPDFIFNVLAGGALGSAFIPTFASALAQNDEARAWRLARSIIAIVFVVMTALAALLALVAPQVVALTVGRGFAASEQQLTADLMRWMLITPIVFGVSGIVMGILNAYQHFVLPALAPALYNAAIIFGALVLAPTMGVYGLVAGVVVGAFAHLLVQLPWFVRAKKIINWQWSIDNFKSPDVVQVGRLMLPRMLGLAAVQINFVVNTILASGLSVGRIAALGYAWRVMLLPVGVIGQSLATVVFPTLSAQTARQAHDEFRDTFSTSLRATLYLTIPASVGLILLGAPVIALLFQRGEFSAASTQETAFALQFYALALFAHSGLEIITRAFYALHDTKTPVMVGVGAMVLNVVLSVALLAPLAHGGLALANSIATMLETLTLFAILWRRLGDIDARRIALSMARVLVASGAMAISVMFVANVLAFAGVLVVIISSGIVGALVYFGATYVMRADELAFVLRRINRKS